MLPFSIDSENSPILTQVNRRDPGRPAEQSTGCHVIWRPWTITIRDTQLEMTATGSSRQFSNDIQAFHHPVRLLIPRSKTQEYLSHLGRKVLASFPVQATLHFYNDDSSSEEENEDCEETEPFLGLEADVQVARMWPRKRRLLFWKQAHERAVSQEVGSVHGKGELNPESDAGNTADMRRSSCRTAAPMLFTQAKRKHTFNLSVTLTY